VRWEKCACIRDDPRKLYREKEREREREKEREREREGGREGESDVAPDGNIEMRGSS